MATIFISDLHLEASRPDIIRNFIALNQTHAIHAEAYYILGDFLEYWIGDDDPAESLAPALDSLRAISAAGVPVYLMHGNRDFLIGQQFVQRYGVTLLPDPTLINLYGHPTLLLHGDTLCIDDHKYQAFRQQVRSKEWQTDFLKQSLQQRHAIVQNLRKMSMQETREKTNDIMDVNQTEIERIMREYNVQQLIHGHTHRPAIHHFLLNQNMARRIVLGDWEQTSSYLLVEQNQYLLEK